MSIKNNANKLTNIKIAKVLSQKYSAQKNFGQNYLTSTRHLYKLADSAMLTEDDTVVEIGPGLGSVTEEILNRTTKVFCFEIDPKKVEFLTEYFGDRINLIHQDFLEIDFEKFLEEKNIKSYKVLSSLPYNVSKPILSKLLTSKNPPASISVIIQKEVGHDITAVPPKAAFLGTFIRIWADIKSFGKIESWNFYPRPKVDGQILLITPKEKFGLSFEDRQNLNKLIKAGYIKPRKQLQSNLKSIYPNISKVLEDLSLKSTIRAQEIDIDTWYNIWLRLNENH